MSIARWALLVAPLLAGGCVTSRGLTPRPGARLEARGSGVTARAKRVHLKWGNYKDQGPDQVIITVANGSGHKVRLKPRRIRLVELRSRAAADEVPREGQSPAVPRVNAGAMTIQAGVGGAQLGGSLSSLRRRWHRSRQGGGRRARSVHCASPSATSRWRRASATPWT